ncbi:MAG: hypothetical protein ABI396_06705 [Ktedonobacteraceae bacterium]
MRDQIYRQTSQKPRTQSADDGEVEIVSLDQAEISGSLVRSPWLHPARMPRRQRTITLRVAVILSFLLLIVLVLPNSVAHVGSTAAGVLQGWFPHPAPTPFSGNSSSTIDGGYYVDVSVPWTQVFIDGRLAHLPLLNKDVPLKLGYGHHIITWHAAPFVAQSCVLSMPQSTGDTCAIAPDTLQQQETSAQILLLRNGPPTLPLKQQTALLQATQTAFANIQDNQLVQPGELYSSGNGYSRATQPLHASLHFTFNFHASGYTLYEVAGQQCQQLCIVPWHYLPSQFAVPATNTTWVALSYVSFYWDYATANGHVVARNQSAMSGAVAMSAYPVLLRVLWTGATWQVTPLIGANQAPPLVISSLIPHHPPTFADKIRLFDNPACVVARFLYSTVGTSYANVRFISGPHPAMGCLVVVNDSSSPSTAYYFEHLGVFLAANDAAHASQPHLPLADSYERTLVEQLAALL